MDYRLLLMIVIALLLVGVMWYMSSSNYTDRIKVILEDKESKLLNDWFKRELSIDITTTDNSVDTELIQQAQAAAISLLKVLHDVDIDNVIVGSNLHEKYRQLTGKNLVPNRTLFNLRDILGLSLEIGIVNPTLHDELNKEKFDKQQLQLLVAIVDHKAYDILLPYVKKVLDHRWTKLLELQDDRITNSNGSYLYLRSDNEEILPNVTGLSTSNNEVRINLLCSEYEFDLLLKRWCLYMKKHVITNMTSDDNAVF